MNRSRVNSGCHWKVGYFFQFLKTFFNHKSVFKIFLFSFPQTSHKPSAKENEKVSQDRLSASQLSWNFKARAEGVSHCVGMWAMRIAGSGDKPFVI